MSNDSLGSARRATVSERIIKKLNSAAPHKDWFDASYQLGMVTPKPCIIHYSELNCDSMSEYNK
jgi:hypothetical protein